LSGRPSPPSPEKVALVRGVLLSHRGRAVTKPELIAATALCDRVVREAIAELVLAGCPIVTDRVSGGFVWTDEKEAIRVEVALLGSHAMRILERKRALEEHLEPQGELFG
jgi:hypothetical protein